MKCPFFLFWNEQSLCHIVLPENVLPCSPSIVHTYDAYAICHYSRGVLKPGSRGNGCTIHFLWESHFHIFFLKSASSTFNWMLMKLHFPGSISSSDVQLVCCGTLAFSERWTAGVLQEFGVQQLKIAGTLPGSSRFCNCVFKATVCRNEFSKPVEEKAPATHYYR